MDLSYTPEEEAFREEVRTWIAGAMPPHIRAKAEVMGHFDHDEVMEWHKLLNERGWIAPHWPKAVGGAELDAARQAILFDELERAATPQLSPFGLVMVGPLITRFGTDEQKARFLPKILSGEEVWCQGYSEPNAGSDLASLRMKAELDGDHFVVNGQKTWTTYAQYADWIFCLVRTDSGGRKQEGISFLLIDMKSKGVEAAPMLTLGHQPAFCDTFFEDVRVPKENLLGPLNGGWTLAKALLGHERTLVGSSGPVFRTLRRARRIAEKTQQDGQPLSDDAAWQQRTAQIEMRAMAHQIANHRTIAQQKAGQRPGPESSILKLVASVLQQDADELSMDTMGHNSLNWLNDDLVDPLEEWVAPSYCYNRATTIYAGSSEIQKNIIAKLLLGLGR